MSGERDFYLQCPIPTEGDNRISLSHGGGGKLMHKLIKQYIHPLYSSQAYCQRDSAVLDFAGKSLVMTTDSYVVSPIFFPGGDIGKLAVCGTVNDLAMSGAIAKFLSVALILEEGFLLADLEKILGSIQTTTLQLGVEVVAGDTKVVERHKGDLIYINTTGIGFMPFPQEIGPEKVMAGDAILVSGDIGRHGVAIMSSRSGACEEVGIDSDCAPLTEPVQNLLRAGVKIHCLRDLTRGGLAAALHEIAETAGLSAELEEAQIPVNARVAAYCDILGIEPYYLANEGRFICILPADESANALSILGNGAMRIGSFRSPEGFRLVMRSPWGTERVVPFLSGEQLPRIC